MTVRTYNYIVSTRLYSEHMYSKVKGGNLEQRVIRNSQAKSSVSHK